MGASWACMAWGQNFNSYNRRTLEAAHILEIHERGNYTEEEFNTLLKSCGIILLEDPANLISLCTVCHNDYFDKQLIAINVVDGESNYSWIVQESVLGDRVPNGSGTYADINNKEIHFEYDQQKPPRNLVLHRLKRFHKGTFSKSSPTGRKLSCKQVCIFREMDIYPRIGADLLWYRFFRQFAITMVGRVTKQHFTVFWQTRV